MIFFLRLNYSVTHWRRKVFNIVGGGGEGQTLVLTGYWWGHWGAQAIFKLIGAPAWSLQPHHLAHTPMLHVPICFEISPERESITCTRYNHCSIIHLCTYMFLAELWAPYISYFRHFIYQEISLKWDVATIALSHLVRGYCTRRGNLNFY